jgi:hypothetical protein
MVEHLPKQLEAWHDFYVVVGGGSAALTGLLFVIVSLGPHVVARQTLSGVKAFISPVATLFTYVLVISAVMLAPEVPMFFLGTALAVAGLGGMIYMLWTGVHGRWRASTLPILDWIWFAGLPFACFAMLLLSGALLAMGSTLGLHGIAAVTVSLIVVGIRNAWDLVLWVAQQPHPETTNVEGGKKAPKAQHRA